jgi:circadian clock protein KaiC
LTYQGTTLVCTSLLDEMSSQTEGGSPLRLSPLADTWIHLNYLVQAGERNRGLSIIKSRGTAHSNQVRELILSDTGVTLSDTYTAGGEVLMGTLRWEKERAERVANEAAEVAGRLKGVRLEVEETELEVRVKSLQEELLAFRASTLEVPLHLCQFRPRFQSPSEIRPLIDCIMLHSYFLTWRHFICSIKGGVKRHVSI